MSRSSDSKSKIKPDAKTKANQPTLTELPADQLDQVTGGQKANVGDIHFVKVVDKSTP